MTASDLALGPIGQVSLFARDIARVEAFYRDTLGLPHLFTFGDLAFFDAAGHAPVRPCRAGGRWKPSSVLYFRVDDIRASFAALEAEGVRTTGAPHLIHRHADSGVEEWMAFFEDGEGNTLAIMSRVAPEDAGAIQAGLRSVRGTAGGRRLTIAIVPSRVPDRRAPIGHIRPRSPTRMTDSTTRHRVTVIPGDGVGPEVTRAARAHRRRRRRGHRLGGGGGRRGGLQARRQLRRARGHPRVDRAHPGRPQGPARDPRRLRREERQRDPAQALRDLRQRAPRARAARRAHALRGRGHRHGHRAREHRGPLRRHRAHADARTSGSASS